VPLGLRESRRRENGAALGRLSFTQVQHGWLFIALRIRRAVQTYSIPSVPLKSAHGTHLGEPACRLWSNFSSSLLTTATGRPTFGLSTFLLSPYPIRRREPQPPDVDHTSPKLATHRSLSSGTGSSGCCCYCCCRWRRCLGSKTCTSATQLAYTEYRHCSRRRRAMISKSVGRAERYRRQNGGECKTRASVVHRSRWAQSHGEESNHREKETKGETNNKSGRLVRVQHDDEKKNVSGMQSGSTEQNVSGATSTSTSSLSVLCKPLFTRCERPDFFSFLRYYELHGASGQSNLSARF